MYDSNQPPYEEEEYQELYFQDVSPKVIQERIMKRKPNPCSFLSSKKYAEFRFGTRNVKTTKNLIMRENDMKANKNGRRQLIVLDDGTEYVGDWQQNLRHGYGAHFTAKGVYTGYFVDDMYEGKGTYTLWSDKTNCDQKGKWIFYDGSWVAGKMEGEGTRYDLNGDTYEGEFYKGKRKGKGTMYYANGDIYIGEWDNDMRNGHGELRKKVGGDEQNPIYDIFEGEYVNDKRNGEGVLHIFETKRRLEGVWLDDYFQGGSYYDEGEDLKYVQPTDISGTTDGLIPTIQLKHPDAVLQDIISKAKARVPKRTPK